MNKTDIPEEMMTKMRSTVIMAGAILRKIQTSNIYISRSDVI